MKIYKIDDIPERWCIIGNYHKLCTTLAQRLQCLPITKHVFTTLHHQRQTRVYTLNGLFLSKYNRHHCTSSYTSRCVGHYTKLQ